MVNEPATVNETGTVEPATIDEPSIDEPSIDEPLLAAVRARLEGHREAIAKTDFYTRSLELLEDVPFKSIRCLALGSPAHEFQALYQLAFLQLVASHFSIKKITVYDPIFSETDKVLFKVLNLDVDASEAADPHTLYYMPHAPRSVTEKLILSVQPRWVLGNDFAVTMGTMTKAKFLAAYPHLAKLVHMAEPPQPKSDGFSTVSRRRRPKKNVYVEPELDYDFPVYFTGISIERIDSGHNERWKDSFSDMALNVIQVDPPSDNK